MAEDIRKGISIYCKTGTLVAVELDPQVEQTWSFAGHMNAVWAVAVDISGNVLWWPRLQINNNDTEFYQTAGKLYFQPNENLPGQIVIHGYRDNSDGIYTIW